jgi:manganese/zinc/iron transport system ATP- binding protein
MQDDLDALCVQQLTVNYDKVPVLWDINFSIPSGNLIGIIGPNGAGKSTLLKAVLGIVRPLSGKIEFFGKPFKKMRSKVAYVQQRSSVDWDFPIQIFDVVLMGRYGKIGMFSWPKQADKEAALRALAMVGMESYADRQISQLSGGQQQRVFIARALLQDADIYLMDEPFAGVDMATEKTIVGLLDQLKSKGKTIFVVHHDLHSIDQYFDWVIMLNTSLIACGPVDQVFHKDTILKAYGGNFAFLDEAARLSQNKTEGMS